MRKFTHKAVHVQVGLGRTEAAERFRVGSDSIWRWKTGRQSPPADVAERICELYGVRFEDIDWGRKEKEHEDE